MSPFHTSKTCKKAPACVNIFYMRMHRKSHLEERLSACADIVKIADISQKNMKISAAEPDILPLEKIFKNGNPVHLEIGCGKGKFVCQTAKLNPGINYIAVEKISNVLIEALERAKAEDIQNVYFINCAAEVLPKYFNGGTISRIYLNFSNPLPKEGYKKQRLTHPKFLNMYSKLLKDGGEIVQKTDDRAFYEFSLAGYRECGYKILSVCEDLAANPVEGDVETEHEKLFKERGKPIFRVVAVKI